MQSHGPLRGRTFNKCDLREVRPWKNGQRDATLLALKVEEGGHKPRNVSTFGKGKEADSPSAPPADGLSL